MGYNTSNYREQGGAKWVVGGELEITGTLTAAEKIEAAHLAADAVTEEKVADGAITADKLAEGAALAAIISAGAGAAAAYAKTTDGAQTLVAASEAGVTKVAVILVVVTEKFETKNTGTDTQPVFVIGETDSTNKFMANSVLVDAEVGDIFVFAGTLTAEKALLVTGTPAVDTGTGAINVTALVVENTNQE